jgi:hypothetical protein
VFAVLTADGQPPVLERVFVTDVALHSSPVACDAAHVVFQPDRAALCMLDAASGAPLWCNSNLVPGTRKSLALAASVAVAVRGSTVAEVFCARGGTLLRQVDFARPVWVLLGGDWLLVVQREVEDGTPVTAWRVLPPAREQ